MDSIGDNVMAIICVVVGILIIGCALVPVVDNASVVENENTIIEETSGYNTLANVNLNSWFGKITEVTIEVSGTDVIVNGSPYTGDTVSLKTNFNGDFYSRTLASQYNSQLRVYKNFDSTLESDYISIKNATAVYADGILTIQGEELDNTAYSHESAIANIWINNALDYSPAEETEIYGIVTSPFTIGTGQHAISNDGTVTIDTSTTEIDNGTIVHNEDGTVTVTTNLAMYAPYKWTGAITHTETTTSDSEYKDLYNIIPVLCILGMAYVLIRRFY